jgi:HEAT repeat protein
MRPLAAHGLALALSLTAGCATSQAMTAASHGDRATLAGDVAAHERRGDLSNAQAIALAQAVAGYEVRVASPGDAVERIHDAWPCAHELDDVLALRAETHDEAGAAAALARVDGGGLDLDDAREYAGDPDPRWRAVGARALVRPEDRDARLRALVDPLPLVRRQAARASRDAQALEDLTLLAETARVDPEPLVRNDAVRAMAALPPTPEGQTARLLQDLWAAGDSGLREDIAFAWASPSVWSAGGREALRILVSSDHHSAAVEAAGAILRRRDATSAGDEVTEDAAAQMVRAIAQGARSTRLQAIAEAPLDGLAAGDPGRAGYRSEILDAIRKTVTEDDPELVVSALGRLAETKDASAIAKLEPLAQPGSPVAVRARFALASAGDRRVQAWIEEGLASKDSDERLAAATALGALGSPGRAAPLLADAEARVRVRAACTILMAGRSAR